MPRGQPAAEGGVGPILLERADQIAALRAHLTSVLRSERGRIVFVGGEAGVGKSALARRFCGDVATPVRVLMGGCDPLFTPRPLGPLLDIAPHLGDDLRALTQRDARPYEVAAALQRELSAGQPTLLLIEDVHWADEATLDVLRFLARRIETVACMIVITYRDDLDRTHPLRVLLGELPPGETIHRLRLAPLSLDAVATLAEPRGFDAAELFRTTGGNPFFVTEALAAGDIAIPPTVRDAVLARVARLPSAAVELLEAIAIVPRHVELWLLEQLAGDALELLDICLGSGILAFADGAVRFRHELARMAIEDTLTPMRRTALHLHALRALESPPTGEPDLARLAHHADAADNDSVLRFAPAAGAHAASLGAHGQAATHYAQALRMASRLQPVAHGELLARHAEECFLADQFPLAIASGWEAVGRMRAAGEPLREGKALRALSHHLRCTGHAHDANTVGTQAVTLLEQLPPGPELALAYANIAYLRLNVDDAENALTIGRRALTLAESLDDIASRIHVLNTLGTVELLAGVSDGVEKLRRSLDLALGAGLEEDVGRAFVNYCWAATRSRLYADFEGLFADGLEYCGERGLVLWRHYVLAYGARRALDQGWWSEASNLAQQVLRDPRTELPRIQALVTLALLRARRGDPECWSLLDEARDLAEPTGELQHIGPVAAARAEAAWLEGRPSLVIEATSPALAVAIERHVSWVIGELACWQQRAGAQTPSDGAAEPYAREMDGAWEAAARLWEERGCPYEAALARAGATDETTLRAALAAFQRLDAHGATRIVARRLRELGARDLPRGPRASTRSNDANLTAREIEVLELVVQGLRNAEIATRLYLSPKTVEHHISAILAKLRVNSRAEAITCALAQGLVATGASVNVAR